jgi:hypothetical protein
MGEDNVKPIKGKAREILTLEKCPTGITGLDGISDGELPKGRPTLISGGAGSGKPPLPGFPHHVPPDIQEGTVLLHCTGQLVKGKCV